MNRPSETHHTMEFCHSAAQVWSLLLQCQVERVLQDVLIIHRHMEEAVWILVMTTDRTQWPHFREINEERRENDRRTVRQAAAMPQSKIISINHNCQSLTSFHTFQTKQVQIWDNSHSKREASGTPERTKEEHRENHSKMSGAGLDVLS